MAGCFFWVVEMILMGGWVLVDGWVVVDWWLLGDFRWWVVGRSLFGRVDGWAGGGVGW